MVAGKQLKSALARVVGQKIPVDEDVLVSDGALAELIKISEQDGILKEVPGLNQYDLLILLIRAGVDAGMTAFADSEKVPSLKTSAYLRETFVSKFEERYAREVGDHYLFLPLPNFPAVAEDLTLANELMLVRAPSWWFYDDGKSETSTEEADFLPALKVKCFGLMGWSTKHSAVIDGFAKVREFLYLGKAYGTLTSNAHPLDEKDKSVIGLRVHVERANKPNSGVKIEKYKLTLLASQLSPNTEPIGLMSFVEDPSPAQKYANFVDHFRRLRPVFDAIQTPDLRLVRSSIEWALEAQLADELSISIVQSFISLEAVLGDDDSDKSIGRISERLADRFSYLVGSTQESRTRLRKNFAELYKQRNQIVHGGAARSSIEHNQRLRSNAESMAEQAIMSEVDRWLKVPRALVSALAGAKPNKSPK